MTVVKIRKPFSEDIMNVISNLSCESQTIKKQNCTLMQDKKSVSSLSICKNEELNDEAYEIEETKEVTFSNFDDLLEYIGEDTSNVKGKKSKKKKNKSNQPMSSSSTQVSSNTPNKSIKKQNHNQTKEIKENDDYVDDFKKLLLSSSVHNNFITKEEPEFDEKWVESLESL